MPGSSSGGKNRASGDDARGDPDPASTDCLASGVFYGRAPPPADSPAAFRGCLERASRSHRGPPARPRAKTRARRRCDAATPERSRGRAGHRRPKFVRRICPPTRASSPAAGRPAWSPVRRARDFVTRRGPSPATGPSRPPRPRRRRPARPRSEHVPGSGDCPSARRVAATSRPGANRRRLHRGAARRGDLHALRFLRCVRSVGANARADGRIGLAAAASAAARSSSPRGTGSALPPLDRRHLDLLSGRADSRAASPRRAPSIPAREGARSRRRGEVEPFVLLARSGSSGGRGARRALARGAHAEGRLLWRCFCARSAAFVFRRRLAGRST